MKDKKTVGKYDKDIDCLKVIISVAQFVLAILIIMNMFAPKKK